MHEIIRCNNVLPMSVWHQATQSIQVGSYEIPSKALIIPLIGQIMHDPFHFPNPSKFNPDRYLSLNEDGNLKFTPHPRVIPFGVGKRRCLGEILAKTSLYKFFTAIIQKFEIVSGQIEPISEESDSGFLRFPKPYKLKFHKHL